MSEKAYKIFCYIQEFLHNKRTENNLRFEIKKNREYWIINNYLTGV